MPRPNPSRAKLQAQTKRSLSPARRRLVERMQRLGFGSIEGLVIRNGEPLLRPGVRIISDVKFGAENGPRPEADLDDFVLKKQVRDFLKQLDALGNVTIRRLEVKHGLPFRMEVEEEKA